MSYLFGYSKKVVIPMSSVTAVRKKTHLRFPNSIEARVCVWWVLAKQVQGSLVCAMALIEDKRSPLFGLTMVVDYAYIMR